MRRALLRCYSFLSGKELRHTSLAKLNKEPFHNLNNRLNNSPEKASAKYTQNNNNKQHSSPLLKRESWVFPWKGQQVTLDLVKTAFTMCGCEDA